MGNKERKPFARKEEGKPTSRSEKGRYEKRERPTLPPVKSNADGRTPKKTTAGSRTRTRKNNNDNK